MKDITTLGIVGLESKKTLLSIGNMKKLSLATSQEHHVVKTENNKNNALDIARISVKSVP